MRDQGKSLAAIARQLHLGYNTVRKFVHAASPETLLAASWQHRRTILEAFKPYLHQRWSQERCSIAQLYAEITKQGYRGSYGTVYAYLQPLRAAGITPAAAPQVGRGRPVAAGGRADPLS